MKCLSQFVASGVLTFSVTASASARCALADYVFQDQDGEEATVRGIKECFRWYNRDLERLSSRSHRCATEAQAANVIRKQKGYDVRLFGTRVFTLSYRHKFFTVSETAVVGSPWLSYEVDADQRKTDLQNFQEGQTAYELLDGGEVKFDFSKEAPMGLNTPEKLYKGLFGRQFVFKLCQRR